MERSASVWVRRLAVGSVVGSALGVLAVVSLGVRAQPQQHPAQPRVYTREGAPRLHVVSKIHTGVQPKSVEVSPDGQRVYVCNFGRPDRDNVKVYDADTLREVGTVNFVGNAVESAFSPDGRTLYVSNFRADKLEVIDRESLQVRGEVSIPGDPKSIALSDDGRTIFVARWSGASVAVIDAETLRIVRNLPTGNHPRGMVAFHDGRLMVAAMYDHVIHDFAPDASRETRRIATCRFPRHLALSPDQTRVFIACSSNRSVEWRNVTTGRRLGFGAAGENPRSMALTDDGRYIATADFDSSTVSIIDIAEMTHRRSAVPGAQRIVGLAVRPGAGPGIRVYATSWETGDLYMLDTDAPATRSARAAPATPAPPAAHSAVVP